MNQTGSIDLHTHSYCSDGTFSPEGLVLLAKKQDLRAIALTDHDTTDGLELFMQAGATHGIETIPGIELACLWDRFHRPELHIIGLGFDPVSPVLLSQMEEIKKSRRERNGKMAEQLTRIGLPVTLEEVEENAGGLIVTRAHFANVLLEKSYIQTRGDAFTRYLSPGLPGYVERNFFTPAQCIAVIKESGGVAILAHPTLYGLATDQIDVLCAVLVPLGLDGIECQYSAYTPAQRKQMTALAKKYNIFPSGGSDFHGANKPDIRLGTGRGSLAVPYAFWEEIKQKTTMHTVH